MNFWNWVERLFESHDDELIEKADAVIAIGIGVSKDGQSVSPQSEAVALKALDLFRQGSAENILLSGGHSNGYITEAEAMANVIKDKVPHSKLFLELRSYRTFMNADYTLPILQQKGWKKVIIVAQQWHARRVRATFRKSWDGTGIRFAVIKARSEYGGSFQKRLEHFLLFVIWDTLAFIISKLKGCC